MGDGVGGSGWVWDGIGEVLIWRMKAWDIGVAGLLAGYLVSFEGAWCADIVRLNQTCRSNRPLPQHWGKSMSEAYMMMPECRKTRQKWEQINRICDEFI